MKPEEVKLTDFYIFIESFNKMIDLLIKQEEMEFDKKRLLIKENLGIKIITTTKEQAIGALEQMRYLPFFLRNGIFQEKEFNIYKEIKLRHLEKLIHTYETSEIFQSCSTSKECVDLNNKVCELKKEKKIIENSFWDNKYIMLSSKTEYGWCDREDSVIKDIVKKDVSKVLELMESSYLTLENDEYFHTVKVKIIKSLKILSKYLQCVELDNKSAEYTKRMIYNFSFPDKYHLKFSETFFGLYPFVSCENFRKLCDNPLINEFCGSSEINNLFNQLAIKEQLAYNKSHNVEDDYRVYISTNSLVEKAFEKYVNNYSPYENAEKFLRQKQEEFMNFEKNEYVERIKKMLVSCEQFFSDIPENIMDITKECDFKFIYKYKGKYDDKKLDDIISKKNQYIINSKKGKHNYLLVDLYQTEMFGMLEGIRKTFYSDEYISQFEKKYNCSSIVEYIYNENKTSLLEFVQLELKKIEDEFKMLHQYLLEKREELLKVKELACQMNIDIMPLLFENKEIEEIKKASLDFTEFWYERLHYNDFCYYYSGDMRVRLHQISNVEDLVFSYVIFLVDCIVTEFFPKFRQQHYGTRKSIDYSLLEEFGKKIKVIK